MKKGIRIFCVFSLVTLALVGCSSSEEDNEKKAAKKLINSIYTVDAQEIIDFNKPVGVVMDTEKPMSQEEYDKKSKASMEEIKEIDKEIVALMTEEGYMGALANQFKSVSTKICVRDNYTAEVTEITLGEDMYKDYKDNEKVRYPYEVKFDLISSDGKEDTSDTAKGTVELIKKDGEWKVCLLGLTQYPKLYK
jgi:uncharacterized protein YcfL